MPLNTIRVFCTAARSESFTEAAKDLHVTQGAVSQQMAKLEDYLGCALFQRRAQRIELTTAGRRLYRGVAESMSRIELELGAARTQPTEQELWITSIASFAAQRLVPDLREFEAAHPHIKLRIETSTKLVNLRQSGMDAAIRMGDGRWPGMHCELLFRDRFYPVASPEFAQTLDSRAPAELLKGPLLYDLEAPTEWQRWAAGAGCADQTLVLNRGFNDTLVTLSALKSGAAGIALISESLVVAELAEGSLVRVSEVFLEPEAGYYLVYPEDAPVSAGLAAFSSWAAQRYRR